jgi:hypothetical protein
MPSSISAILQTIFALFMLGSKEDMLYVEDSENTQLQKRTTLPSDTPTVVKSAGDPFRVSVSY